MREIPPLHVMYNGDRIAIVRPNQRVSFGRGVAADVQFTNADIHVSRIHFRLFLSAEGRIMLSVDGLNGLEVNGRDHVPKGSSVMLSRGDFIELYGYVFVLE